MAVPFILLGGAALAGITGAVKSVSAHTKNANAKQIVAEAQNIYDEAREMLEEQRTCTAECLKRLGVLKVDIWSKEMNDLSVRSEPSRMSGWKVTWPGMNV